MGRKGWLALSAWAIAGAIYVVTHRADTQFAMYWIFGLAFGFVLQRGRFCFASAFRDLFLLGYGRNMKGVLVGLAVGSVGFALVMSRQVPMANLGILPPSANVLPLGVHTAVGPNHGAGGAPPSASASPGSNPSAISRRTWAAGDHRQEPTRTPLPN